MQEYDVVIVGGGVIGTAIARELPGRRVAILEKEDAVARHASGRNSGVIHSGFYYSADSLKARLCRDGNRLMKEYCRERKIPLGEYGKVVVVRDEKDLETLHLLERRGRENAVEVELIDEKKLKELEPYASTFGEALHSPTTASVDPVLVTRSFADDAVRNGAEFLPQTEMQGLEDDSTLQTTKGKIKFGHLINCAGLHADRIAHMFGVGNQYTILPFRGNYYQLRTERAHLVRSNIYPVPDMRNPFLGVHFTRTVYGDVIVGPTATPVLGRENYQGLQGANIADLPSIALLQLKLFLTDKTFRDTVREEVKRYGRNAYAREAATILPEVKPEDLIETGRSGIRAQLFDKQENRLVSDFVVENGKNSTHVLNAVSPAFTCSIPFARYVIQRLQIG